ncbi:MAG TPA: STAS domain-containing protein [Actinophytocola sp.]|nr:STAS domain-containing protein [Actinophytocola sp.]
MDQPLHLEQPLPEPSFFDCHTVQLADGVVLICVHGEIDDLTAPTLEACLDQQWSTTPRAGQVEVALIHTTFIGARAITTLLDAAHAADMRTIGFQVTGCSPHILRVIELVGMREELAASASPATVPHCRR